MNPTELKRKADVIRKCMTGEHYYDTRYKDLKVADLLLVLEDENYHTEETILEALATIDYYKILEACEIEVAQYKAYELPYEKMGEVSDALHERLRKLDKEIRKEQLK